jgi:choline dehydrogenase
VGVDYLDGDGRMRSVNARQGVIVCAGTVNSPKLLQLSGVGPAALLQQHGIAPVHDLPGVGENLRDHYGARLVFRVRSADSLNGHSSGLPLAKQILRWWLGLPSIVGMAPVMCYGFGRSDPALSDPDVAFSFAPASMKLGTIGLLDDFPGMTCAGWKHRPDSTGHVRIASGDARAAPLINPMYLADERDRRTAVAALKMVRRLFATDPIARYADAETFPGPQVQTDDEWLDFARQFGSGTYHLTGTCRMGQASDASTVVGPDLKVHGIAGLHVIDASVMPTEPSANTYAATMMIAEKGADMILGKAPLPAEHI